MTRTCCQWGCVLPGPKPVLCGFGLVWGVLVFSSIQESIKLSINYLVLDLFYDDNKVKNEILRCLAYSIWMYYVVLGWFGQFQWTG